MNIINIYVEVIIIITSIISTFVIVFGRMLLSTTCQTMLGRTLCAIGDFFCTDGGSEKNRLSFFFKCNCSSK